MSDQQQCISSDTAPVSGFLNAVYKPDVLQCLANLSNDEVFTPPDMVNKILDMLPQELFSNPEIRFLDPVSKSGVFLREIAKRLIEGLKDQIPDLQKRLDHIFHNQLFGIAITELTALMSRRSVYCSKNADSKWSISAFETAEGNIAFHRIKHSWEGKSCKYCGASKSEYDRTGDLETHAYQFIHPGKIFENMKFDVIIGNPPYQLNTGSKTQATPLYDKFVRSAKKLSPAYLVMITPSRWFAGGMGLDSFRQEMLNDQQIRKIVDYPNAKDCFPGTSIGGGVNYFLWKRDSQGQCEYTNVLNGKEDTQMRVLNQYPFFVRYNSALRIIEKIQKSGFAPLSEIVSPLMPFGLDSKVRGEKERLTENDLIVHSSQGAGYISADSVSADNQWVNSYKIMVSKTTSEHAGEPDKNGQFKVLSTMKKLGPREVCTFSYFIIGNFDDEAKAENLMSYLKTKFCRFLLLQAVSSINLSKDKFIFVPLQDFSKPWTDEELYQKYNLEKDEIDFINSMIRPME